MRYSTALLLFCFLPGCDDDTRVDPDLGRTLFGFAKSSQHSASKFYYKDANPIQIDFRWKSLDQRDEVAKIEFYIQFNEPYFDKNGNLMLAKHGGDNGVLFSTWEGAEVPAGNETKQLVIHQEKVFEVLRNATFDYSGDQIQIPVFANPATPARIQGGRFLVGDEFRLTWSLVRSDGQTLDEWPLSICKGSSESNCSFNWVTACSLDTQLFTGAYICDEPDYRAYPVEFVKSVTLPGAIINTNFWDVDAAVTFFINSSTKMISIPSQTISLDGVSYSVTGRGEIETCSGEMSINYVIANANGGIIIEENTHRYQKAD